MTIKLMVKDLLTYHIREEQEKIKEHQDRLQKFLTAYMEGEECKIDLNRIDLPFDQQPKNTVKDIPLFEQGKLISGNDFSCYDYRHLRAIDLVAIEPQPYRCEINWYEPVWVLHFEGHCVINFYGPLVDILTFLKWELEIVEENVDGEMTDFTFDTEKRKVIATVT